MENAKGPQLHAAIDVGDDVEGGEENAGGHAADGGNGPHPPAEDAQDDDREEAGRRQAEGEGHHLADEARRVDAEQAGHHHRQADDRPSHQQALTFIGPRVDHAEVDVVGDGG